MSNYIHFSPEQKDKAYHMDIAELLRKQGEKLNRCGNEYIWESPTGKVSIRNNVWYHHYEQEGGNVVSFLQKFFNKTYSEAMEYLLNENGTIMGLHYHTTANNYKNGKYEDIETPFIIKANDKDLILKGDMLHD